jgi:hypothetical protein
MCWLAQRETAGVMRIHSVGLGSALGRSIIEHGVGQFDLDQCARASIHYSYSMMPKTGGLDASLIQSPLVDFQSLERLESSLFELC